MNTDLASVLGTRETVSLEFKESSNNRDSLGKAICALANDLAQQGGGDLLVVVRDDGSPVDDINTSDRELLRLTDLRDSGQILDRPSMTVQAGLFLDKPIIRIHVDASTTPPVRFKGVVWVRPGPTTREATREDERILTERRRCFDTPFDSRPISNASMEDLDLLLFRSTYLPSFVASEVLEENHRTVEQQLASLRLSSTDGTPTVLGLLILGVDPSNYLPGAYLQFIRYAGRDVSSPISDDQEIRTNIVGTAAHLEATLRGHLHTRLQETTNFQEEQRPDYPIEALREACMNAIMHRNYETSYAPVRISWFDDRIEITNPGGPYGQVRTDNFDRVNDYRNPSLAAALKSLGYVNRFGRGIGRIRSSLEKNGNPGPLFSVDQTSWSVTLRRSS